jgi:HlyD family secretion protein
MVQANNPGLILLPGMTANVKILTAERSNVLRLASAALRFRPPATGDAAAQPGGARGGAGAAAGPGGAGATGSGTGRGRGFVRMTPEVMKDLGLTPDQQAKVSAALAELRQRQAAAPAASNPLGGGVNFGRAFGGNNDAQLMRQRMQNMLAGILTDQQLMRYQALGASNAVRTATVWVLDASGALASKEVRIGLQADSQTELVSGLKEGDKVVVRSRAGKPG